jgi:hypothetical protein
MLGLFFFNEVVAAADQSGAEGEREKKLLRPPWIGSATTIKEAHSYFTLISFF